jgi:hypothetical protein
VDVTERAGIHFQHNLGDLEMNNIAEATGPGGLFFDYDNDGFQDIYFVNGRWHTDISDNRGRILKGKLYNALYRNNGDGTFSDVTGKAGVGGREDSYGWRRPRRTTTTTATWISTFSTTGPTSSTATTPTGRSLMSLNQQGSSPPVSAGRTCLTSTVTEAGLFVVHYLQYDKGAFQRTGAYYKAESSRPLSYPGLPDHLYRTTATAHSRM